MILFNSDIFVVLLLWLRHLLVTLLTAIVFKRQNGECITMLNSFSSVPTKSYWFTGAQKSAFLQVALNFSLLE